MATTDELVDALVSDPELKQWIQTQGSESNAEVSRIIWNAFYNIFDLEVIRRLVFEIIVGRVPLGISIDAASVNDSLKRRYPESAADLQKLFSTILEVVEKDPIQHFSIDPHLKEAIEVRFSRLRTGFPRL